MNTFEPYYDPLDMTTCVTATSTLAEINAKASKDKLYYPLVLNPAESIDAQIRAIQYCPESYRYGSLSDNILGMTIRVNDNEFRIGSRVVKNATGYDLNRFIASKVPNFVSIKNVILRLRPQFDKIESRKIRGTKEALIRIIKELNRSSWSHVINALTLHITTESNVLYMSFSCEERSIELYDEMIIELAGDCEISSDELKHSLSLSDSSKIKATISESIKQAFELTEKFAGEALCFPGNGYLLHQADASDELKSYLNSLNTDLASMSGHVDSSMIVHQESEWEIEMREKLEQHWMDLV
ncbi:MAG: FAD-binding oxidoreductase [Lentisphaeria bacterium]|nr:hypothetical protein [Lentisphaeria bacterium]NQZ67729.1 FAD-binding oxidoreductase [Lentisphaeria bacterium]